MKSIQRQLYQQFLSEKTREISERVIIILALSSFIIHLLIIALVNFEWVKLETTPELLSSPIAAIYTPFSFILVYEVYLLIYYLPKSFTTYIGKQYEIITLIVIRRIFKDISKVDLKGWSDVSSDLQLAYDLLATIVLFFLIYLFYLLDNKHKVGRKKVKITPKQKRFVQIKRALSVALVPILLVLALYSFGNWIYENILSVSQMVSEASEINTIFFDDFFTILILVDVFLLLLSFIYTDQFWTVIRNSGFIISTILIKLSFSANGLLNPVLIVSAVSFGVIILWVYGFYEQLNFKDDEN